MNKTELIQELAERLDFVRTQKNATAVVDTFCEIIGDALKNEEAVQIMGFGKFSAKLVKGREGKNPQNPKEKIVIPDSLRVYFSSGQALKDKVNSGLNKKSSKKDSKKAAPAKKGKATAKKGKKK